MYTLYTNKKYIDNNLNIDVYLTNFNDDDDEENKNRISVAIELVPLNKSITLIFQKNKFVSASFRRIINANRFSFLYKNNKCIVKDIYRNEKIFEMNGLKSESFIDLQKYYQISENDLINEINLATNIVNYIVFIYTPKDLENLYDKGNTKLI